MHFIYFHPRFLQRKSLLKESLRSHPGIESLSMAVNSSTILRTGRRICQGYLRGDIFARYFREKGSPYRQPLRDVVERILDPEVGFRLPERSHALLRLGTNFVVRREVNSRENRDWKRKAIARQ
jgi:hypothetical protein